MSTLHEALDRIEVQWVARTPTREYFDFRSSLVALFRVGSHSHGTYIPPSDPQGIDDIDFMAVVIPPQRDILGFTPFQHKVIKVNDLDLVVYEWGKWLRMLAKSNPNVLGTLWIRAEDVFIPRPEILRGSELRDYTRSLLAYPAFIGYAHGQLHRMTHHAFEGYMGDKRKKLVEKHGYDTKNAAHLIRLLRMGCEFLETGTMNVWRKDAATLKEIKAGGWSLEQVQQEATALFERAKVARDSSTLPDHPNVSAIEQIMLDGYNARWRKAGS